MLESTTSSSPRQDARPTGSGFFGDGRQPLTETELAALDAAVAIAAAELRVIEAAEAAARWEDAELAAAAPRRRRTRSPDALLLTAHDAAALLGLSVDTLRDMNLPAVRLPRRPPPLRPR